MESFYAIFLSNKPNKLVSQALYMVDWWNVFVYITHVIACVYKFLMFEATCNLPLIKNFKWIFIKLTNKNRQ